MRDDALLLDIDEISDVGPILEKGRVIGCRWTLSGRDDSCYCNGCYGDGACDIQASDGR